MALKKRLVVVGIGSIGMRHARLLSTRKDILVELCDSKFNTLSNTSNQLIDLPQHQSFDEMIESRPAMVLIATPHRFHVEQTISALEAGAHVLCEKPMSNSLDTAYRVLEVANQGKQTLVYGFSYHFHPGILKIKKIIESGQLGEIQYTHFHVGTYGTLVNSLSRFQANTEAALLMDYVHQPDLLYWMLGKHPEGVYALGSMGGNLELSSNPNSMTLLLDYKESFTASIHLNYLQYPDRYHYEFIGNKGWIYYDLIANTIYFGNRKSENVKQEQLHFQRDDIYIEEHQAFFDAISGKRPPESSAEDALQSMLVMEASIKSWKTKQRVTIKEISNRPSLD